jgi:hypothetical protein
MSPLDNDAARALQKILSGDRSDWISPERTAWTTFILSLFFRNPGNVTIIKDHIRHLWEHGKAALEANYAGRRRRTDPETLRGLHGADQSGCGRDRRFQLLDGDHRQRPGGSDDLQDALDAPSIEAIQVGGYRRSMES